jgi:NAD(P)-dependent dehydrogenase (short-subunit alcohol dehydrogenase family)
MKDLTDKVVVITGASSGIGRATAIECARAGANVVIAGRDSGGLKETQDECEGVGGSAMAIVCDVTREEQVEQLAGRAEEAYGRIDTWINNAGVTMFAKFDDAPDVDFKRVIDTNFYGYVYGTRAALKRFRSQNSGTIINIDAVDAVAAKPYESAYAASQHAVRALASSLRMELALDGLNDIRVCTVLTSNVDTPLYAHAANYTGRAVQGSASSSSPVRVAAAIVRLIVNPAREIAIGSHARSQMMRSMLTPASYEHAVSRSFTGQYLTDEIAGPTHGNLYDPTSPHAISGGWKRPGAVSLGANVPLMAAAGTILAVTGLLAWALWPSRSNARDAYLD